jgi:ribosomal protein S12 methylthiotransferase
VTAALIWAFTGLGLAVSVFTRNVARAMVHGLILWALGVALVDFALVGAMLQWSLNPRVVFLLAALNPVQAARLALLAGLATDLETLLDALVRIDDLVWIRLHYAYPSAVTDGLVHRIAHEPKVACYLDVPMQHVDGDVLKRMRRGYGERRVRELVESLRDPAKVGSARVWLRTTMLVGHPGETEAAYQRLHDFVAEGHIDHLGVFPWSREDGTASALLPGRVTQRKAQERAAALMELQAQLRARAHAGLVGTRLRVMVDGVSEDSELLLDGRHEGQAPGIDGKVVLTDGTAAVGTIVEAIVTQAGPHDLVASMDAEAAAAALADRDDD